MTDTSDDIVVSLKAHTGYDSPFIAVKGATAADVIDKLRAIEATGLWAVLGDADTSLKAQFTVGSVLGGTPVAHPNSVPQAGYAHPAPPVPQAAYQPQPAPQPAVQGPPGMVAPTCPHGTKTYKESKPGAPKKWKAWMCPARQGDPSQCPPEWI